MNNSLKQKIDPLYIIFEQHLFNFEDPSSDRRVFVEGVAKEYLVEMRKVGLVVPNEWEPYVMEELCLQVNTMLVKKIYGCLSIQDYLSDKNMAPKSRNEKKRKAQRAYSTTKKQIGRVAKKVASR